MVTSCNHSITALSDEIKEVKAEISYVRHDMHKLRERTAALEGRLSTVEDDMTPMQRDLKYNCHPTEQHAMRLDEMENRMRLNNVRALGIPEKTEGKNPVDFIEQWLISTFGRDSFSPLFAVERAHRVPACPLPPGNHPRPFLFKLLNYKDRDAILSKARALSDKMKIDNSRISLFPDFSAELQKKVQPSTKLKRSSESLMYNMACYIPPDYG